MRRVGEHLLFWIAYIFFKTYLNVTAETSALIPATAADASKYLMILSTQLTFLTVKVPVVYACFYGIDRYLENKWTKVTTIAALAFTITCGVFSLTLLNHKIILPLILDYHGPVLAVFNVNSLLYYVFTLVFVVGAAVSLKLMRKQYQSKLKEAELQKEKTETELKYLKGQINPHFLFNTLNNIYSLARKQAAQTPEAIMKLSKLMRFMLYEAGNSKIRLTDELRLIEDYIALEKLRYADRLQVEFKAEIDNTEQTIAPLLLIHFVENAFKHGAGESRFESSIQIEIRLSKHLLTAIIKNTKEGDALPDRDGKIGLENIRRQLELLYPHHTLNLSNQQHLFIVELTIPLDTNL